MPRTRRSRVRRRHPLPLSRTPRPRGARVPRDHSFRSIDRTDNFISESTLPRITSHSPHSRMSGATIHQLVQLRWPIQGSARGTHFSCSDPDDVVSMYCDLSCPDASNSHFTHSFYACTHWAQHSADMFRSPPDPVPLRRPGQPRETSRPTVMAFDLERLAAVIAATCICGTTLRRHTPRGRGAERAGQARRGAKATAWACHCRPSRPADRRTGCGSAVCCCHTIACNFDCPGQARRGVSGLGEALRLSRGSCRDAQLACRDLAFSYGRTWLSFLNVGTAPSSRGTSSAGPRNTVD